MGKNDKPAVDTAAVEEAVEAPAETKAQSVERETDCVFVSDGKYKYVYRDTGEDVV